MIRRGSRTHVVREHRIPTAGSSPAGLCHGPDRSLWFCESGTSKIGRLSLENARIGERALPTSGARPTAIAAGPDGNLWFTESAAHKIGRITPQGEIAEFVLPTATAGPRGIVLGPDGNLWFAETDAGQIGRITPAGMIREFCDGLPPDARPLAAVACGEHVLFSDFAGQRLLRVAVDGTVTTFAAPISAGDPGAITIGRDGRVWFIATSADAIGHLGADGSVAELPSLAGARPRGIICARNGDLLIAADGINAIVRMNTRGEVLAEYPVPTPNAGLRAMAVIPDGRVFFTEGNAGRIGELVEI